MAILASFMKICEKEAGMAITLPFCMIFLENSHKKIEQIKTGLQFKSV